MDQQSVDAQIAAALITYGIDLARYQSGVRRTVLQELALMHQEWGGFILASGIATVTAVRAERIIARANEIIAQHYATIGKTVQGEIKGLVRVEAVAVMDALKETRKRLNKPKVAELDEVADDLLVFGRPLQEWWERQSRDVQVAYSNAVRQGRANGEGVAGIVNRILDDKGIASQTRKSATFLARDMIAGASAQARMETFERNSDVIRGYVQISTLDNSTSEICLAYSGATWDKNYQPMDGNDLPYNGGCPRHRNCRSVISVLTEEIDGVPSFRTSQRASRDGPVPVNMTMQQFMETQGEAKIDKQLGPGKAQMWRDGTITLRDLLDDDGNALTLKELQERYGSK